MIKTKLSNAGTAGSYTLVAVVALALVASAAWYLSTEAGDNNLGVVRHLVPSETNEPNVGTEVGQIAPNFVDVDNDNFTLDNHRGNVVALDFMATWCPPCVEEMGHLRQIYSNYSASRVIIMSIDVDPSETDETILQFKTNYGDDWIFASGPIVGTTYGVRYIPTMYIIDQQGRIVYKNIGVTSASTLAAEIDKLL